jgi:hypothetical protein
MSRTPVPIPTNLALTLSAHVAEFSTDWVMCDPWGKQMGPWQLHRGFRRARGAVVSLPECFRFHDLRHYDASLLISSGLDVKVLQARLRHASAGRQSRRRPPNRRSRRPTGRRPSRIDCSSAGRLEGILRSAGYCP